MRRSNLTLKGLRLLALAAVITSLAAGQASASIVFPLDFEFSGGTSPEGTAPWLTATIEDLGLNMVRLTMSADSLTDSEFISTWRFNLDPSLTGSLSFTPIDISAVSFVDALYSPDTYKVAGNRFDIDFQFARANKNRFNAGETVIYDITYSGDGTFDALAFNFGSSPDGTYQSAAHVQGIGSGSFSGWIGNTTVIPEPTTTALLSFGGLGVFGARRLRRKGLSGFFDFPVVWRPLILALSGPQTVVESANPVSDFLWKLYFRMERATVKAATKGVDTFLALLIPQVFVQCFCPDCGSLHVRLSHHRSRGKLMHLLRLHRYVCKKCHRRFISGA
jgi:hypothetical protein